MNLRHGFGRAFLLRAWRIPFRLVTIVAMKTIMRTALFLLLAGTAAIPAAAQADSATQFKRMCVLCHGADGKSDTAMGKSLKSADLTSQAVQSQTDAQLYEVIAKGKGKMAAYETILGGKSGVESMVKYVRTLGTKKK